MKKKVVIINTGSGNIFNVSRAFAHCNGDTLVTTDPHDVETADYLVLPGVGTFGHCIQTLEKLNLIDSIRRFAESSRPFMGICVGMQILFDAGYEFGEHKGLGLLAGCVKKIPRMSNAAGKTNKVPHIGWYKLNFSHTNDKLLLDVEDDIYAYFVHSYMAELPDHQSLLAYYDAAGMLVPALVKKDNLYGSQCHLEKSGKVGLKIIANFLKM